MCFSATASFIAGVSLTAIGIATIKKAKKKSEIPFATIPILFGIQQLIEGVIWLTFKHEAPLLKQIMTYLYSGFSHGLWPIYIPLSVGILETVRLRKKILLAFTVVAACLSFYLLYFIVTRPVLAQVIGKHIVYVSPHFHVIPIMVLYISTTCISCFFSSHAFLKLFGGLALLAFIAAYIVDLTALFSVWCFFAAILSLLIYFHLDYVKPIPIARHRYNMP